MANPYFASFVGLCGILTIINCLLIASPCNEITKKRVQYMLLVCELITIAFFGVMIRPQHWSIELLLNTAVLLAVFALLGFIGHSLHNGLSSKILRSKKTSIASIDEQVRFIGDVLVKSLFIVLPMYSIATIIFTALVLVYDKRWFGDVVYILEGIAFFFCATAYIILFTRFRTLVGIYISKLQTRSQTKYVIRHMESLQGVRSKVLKLIIASAGLGYPATFVLLWNHAGRYATSDPNQRWSEFNSEENEEETFPYTWFALLLCYAAVIYYAWIPINPFGTDIGGIKTSASPSPAISSFKPPKQLGSLRNAKIINSERQFGSERIARTASPSRPSMPGSPEARPSLRMDAKILCDEKDVKYVV